MTKLESLYKWLESNVEYVNDLIKIVRVGSYKTDNNTLYGNYKEYCIKNNLPIIGIKNFVILIVEYFKNKKIPIKVFTYGKIRYVRFLTLVKN